jgi:DNA-binding LacI/PurR family transcriptional regulator
VALAVDHLVGLGHRAIAFLDGGRGTIAADRRRGYRSAMRRHGLADAIRILPGDHSEAAGSQAAAAVRGGGGVGTAVVASNDRSAVGLVDALARAGIEVPGGLSVVGYDDSALARLAHINLTSVSQDGRRQAEEAVTAAVSRLDDGGAPTIEIVLAPRLVVRGSTGPPSRRTP